MGLRQSVLVLVLASLPACEGCLHQAPPPRSVQGQVYQPVVAPTGPAASRTPPKPQHPGKGTFGGQIEYLGYDVSPVPARAGLPVVVTDYFHALKDIPRDWEIFVHVDSRSGGERINGDHFPVEGTLHTNAWKAGDYIADRFSFTPAQSQANSVVDLWTGFYEGDERLPISNPSECQNDGNNRLMAGTIALQ